MSGSENEQSDRNALLDDIEQAIEIFYMTFIDDIPREKKVPPENNIVYYQLAKKLMSEQPMRQEGDAVINERDGKVIDLDAVVEKFFIREFNLPPRVYDTKMGIDTGVITRIGRETRADPFSYDPDDSVVAILKEEDLTPPLDLRQEFSFLGLPVIVENVGRRYGVPFDAHPQFFEAVKIEGFRYAKMIGERIEWMRGTQRDLKEGVFFIPSVEGRRVLYRMGPNAEHFTIESHGFLEEDNALERANIIVARELSFSDSQDNLEKRVSDGVGRLSEDIGRREGRSASSEIFDDSIIRLLLGSERKVYQVMDDIGQVQYRKVLLRDIESGDVFSPEVRSGETVPFFRCEMDPGDDHLQYIPLAMLKGVQFHPFVVYCQQGQPMAYDIVKQAQDMRTTKEVEIVMASWLLDSGIDDKLFESGSMIVHIPSNYDIMLKVSRSSAVTSSGRTITYKVFEYTAAPPDYVINLRTGDVSEETGIARIIAQSPSVRGVMEDRQGVLRVRVSGDFMEPQTIPDTDREEMKVGPSGRVVGDGVVAGGDKRYGKDGGIIMAGEYSFKKIRDEKTRQGTAEKTDRRGRTLGEVSNGSIPPPVPDDAPGPAGRPDEVYVLGTGEIEIPDIDDSLFGPADGDIPDKVTMRGDIIADMDPFAQDVAYNERTGTYERQASVDALATTKSAAALPTSTVKSGADGRDYKTTVPRDGTKRAGAPGRGLEDEVTSRIEGSSDRSAAAMKPLPARPDDMFRYYEIKPSTGGSIVVREVTQISAVLGGLKRKDRTVSEIRVDKREDIPPGAWFRKGVGICDENGGPLPFYQIDGKGEHQLDAGGLDQAVIDYTAQNEKRINDEVDIRLRTRWHLQKKTALAGAISFGVVMVIAGWGITTSQFYSEIKEQKNLTQTLRNTLSQYTSAKNESERTIEGATRKIVAAAQQMKKEKRSADEIIDGFDAFEKRWDGFIRDKYQPLENRVKSVVAYLGIAQESIGLAAGTIEIAEIIARYRAAVAAGGDIGAYMQRVCPPGDTKPLCSGGDFWIANTPRCEDALGKLYVLAGGEHQRAKGFVHDHKREWCTPKKWGSARNGRGRTHSYFIIPRR